LRLSVILRRDWMRGAEPQRGDRMIVVRQAWLVAATFLIFV